MEFIKGVMIAILFVVFVLMILFFKMTLPVVAGLAVVGALLGWLAKTNT